MSVLSQNRYRSIDNSIKIAIVDTGISSLCRSSFDNIIAGVSVKQSANNCGVFFEVGCYEDHHGHGTAIASLLSVFCPRVQLIPVCIAQILDGQHKFCIPEKVLAQGIDWCIEQGIRLVNVSYSIEEVSANGPLALVCTKAAKNNIIIVAAYRNACHKPVYPATFPSVIGVSIQKNLEHSQIAIVSETNFDIAAFGGPYQITTLDNKTQVVRGTSFATAQVTGMVARMLVIKPFLTTKQVFNYFKKYAIVLGDNDIQG